MELKIINKIISVHDNESVRRLRRQQNSRDREKRQVELWEFLQEENLHLDATNLPQGAPTPLVFQKTITPSAKRSIPGKQSVCDETQIAVLMPQFGSLPSSPPSDRYPGAESENCLKQAWRLDLLEGPYRMRLRLMREHSSPKYAPLFVEIWPAKSDVSGGNKKVKNESITSMDTVMNAGSSTLGVSDSSKNNSPQSSTSPTVSNLPPFLKFACPSDRFCARGEAQAFSSLQTMIIKSDDMPTSPKIAQERVGVTVSEPRLRRQPFTPQEVG